MYFALLFCCSISNRRWAGSVGGFKFVLAEPHQSQPPPLPPGYWAELTLSQTKDLFFARILHTDEIPFLFNGMQRVKQKLTYTLYYASQWTFFVWKILSMEFRSLCYAPTTEFQFRLELCVVKTPRFKLNLKPQDMKVHEFFVYVSIGMNFNLQVFTT